MREEKIGQERRTEERTTEDFRELEEEARGCSRLLLQLPLASSFILFCPLFIQSPLLSSFNLVSSCVLFYPLKSSLPSISSSFLLVIAETPRSEAVSKRNCAQRQSTEPSMMPKGGTQKPAMPKKTAKTNDHTDIIFCILCRVMLFLTFICFSCSL